MENRKNIPGYETSHQVSNLWNVRTVSRQFYVNKKLRSWEIKDISQKISSHLVKQTDVDWYKRVNLLGKRYLVHRLVYMTFNGIPLEFKWQKSKTLVLHKNDIKYDNRLENLFLWTQYDNVLDMYSKWRQRKYVKPLEERTHKINLKIANKIREDYKKTRSIYKTAVTFGISYATVSRIKNNKIRTERLSVKI